MKRRTNTERAAELHEWLLGHIEVPYLHADLAPVIDMAPGAKFREVLALASELAEDDGLCLRTACGANENRVMLTADPNEVVDSALHVGATRRGVARRERRQARFIVDRARPGSDADMLKPILAFALQQEEALAQFIEDSEAAMIRQRREKRREAREQASAQVD